MVLNAEHPTVGAGRLPGDTATDSRAARRATLGHVAERFRDPAFYPEGTSRVQVIETHISWVFLTDRHAYKLKKPVRFDFVDFSTVEHRRAACKQEVELNRRLAPGVYLDVIPVRRTGKKYCLGGDPNNQSIVDWAVKMVRLPADRTLEAMICADRLSPDDVRQIAVTLNRFYARLPPLIIRTEEYWRRVDSHVRDNSRVLHGVSQESLQAQVDRVHGILLRYLDLCREEFEDRVRNGRIVDGHGDLRPEHVYLTNPTAILDCLEFSADLRALDVADELAFLAMETERLGAPWVGQQIMQRYLLESGDRPTGQLIDFFKCYRACVRAKVHLLRARQQATAERAGESDTVWAYMEMADRYATRLGRPLLMVVRGLSGTGKSTLARSLADAWQACLIQTDEVRQQLFGSRESTESDAYADGRYRPENRARVYAEMFAQAASALARGANVILDGTFLSRALRNQALDVARRNQSAALLVHCQCPEFMAHERVSNRAPEEGLSEIRPEWLNRQREDEEPDDSAWPSCQVDTSEGLDFVIRTVAGQAARELGLCPQCVLAK